MVRRVDTVAVAIAAGPGSATYTYTLNPHDLSQAQALLLEIVATAIANDSNDVFDVRLQDTTDGLKWHDRARMTAIAGNQAASAGAPYYQRIVVQQNVAISSTEQNYIPDGSSGAAALAAGSVINGPFPRVLRKAPTTAPGPTTAIVGYRQPSWRVQIIVTDPTGTNAALTATLNLFADSKFRVH